MFTAIGIVASCIRWYNLPALTGCRIVQEVGTEIKQILPHIDQAIYCRSQVVDFSYTFNGGNRKLSSKYMGGGVYTTLQFFLWNVKEFHLISEEPSCVNPNDIVFLLQNCPCLERVFLDLGEFCFEAGNYWEIYSKHELEKCHPGFQELKKIIVKGFKLQHLEIQMLEFFLSKARNLESMALVPSNNYQSERLLQQLEELDQLFSTWKASPKTKIRIFKNMRMFKLWSF